MLNIKILVTTLLILCSFCNSNGRRKSGRKIVNGFSINVEEAPFQASIEANKNGTYKNICGGSIISSTWILTAAHCIVLSKDMPDKRVLVGRTKLMDEGKVHTIKREIAHPLYKDYHTYDIGLLELNEPIVFGLRAKPVRLSEHSLFVGTLCKTHGFGRLELGGGSPSYLQAMWVQVRPPELCAAAVTAFDKDHAFCTLGYNGTAGFCNGDSGGPLTCGGVQYGISSYKTDCKAELPDYYADIYRYRDFIKEHTGL